MAGRIKERFNRPACVAAVADGIAKGSGRSVPGLDLGAAVIAYFDELTARNVVPHLPGYLKDIPRANIEFLPIQDAWFSGSMNYLGRARKADGPILPSSWAYDPTVKRPEYDPARARQLLESALG